MSDEERLKFHQVAKPVVLSVEGLPVVLTPKSFSSGSVGWHGNTKVDIQGFWVQVNFICTVVGSKVQGKNVGNSRKVALEEPGAPQALFEAENPSSIGEAVSMSENGKRRARKGVSK